MADCCDCCKKIGIECCKDGLGAIKNSDKRKMRFSSSRDIKCSIDIDTCLQKRYPNANRWDYLICYKGNSIFVEIHPAENISNVKEVLKKKMWLKDIIKCINLQTEKTKFHWISSGRNKVQKSLLPNSVYKLMLDKERIILGSYLNES